MSNTDPTKTTIDEQHGPKQKTTKDEQHGPQQKLQQMSYTDPTKNYNR